MSFRTKGESSTLLQGNYFRLHSITLVDSDEQGPYIRNLDFKDGIAIEQKYNACGEDRYIVVAYLKLKHGDVEYEDVGLRTIDILDLGQDVIKEFKVFVKFAETYLHTLVAAGLDYDRY